MYTLELTSTCTVKKGKKEKFAAEFSEREAGKGDLTIQVKDDSTQVHRAVLRESSDYFATMFSGKFSESDAASLNLSNVFNHVDEANAVFDFIYTGVIVLTEENIECIVNAARLFLLSDLCDACSEFLTTNLAPCTCLSIFPLAIRYSLDNLYDACIEILMSWFQFMLCNKPEALEITPDIMVCLIDELVFHYVPENIVESFMRKWYQHFVESTEGSVSLPPDLKDYLSIYITEIDQPGKDPQHSGDRTEVKDSEGATDKVESKDSEELGDEAEDEEGQDSKTKTEAKDPQDSKTKTEAKDPQDSKTKTEAKDPQDSKTKTEAKDPQDSKTKTEAKDPQDSKTKTEARDTQNSEDGTEDLEVEGGFSDKHYLGLDSAVSSVKEVLYTTLKGPVAGSTRCCIEIHVFSGRLMSWKFVLRHAFSEVVSVGAVPKLIDVNENKAYFVLVKDDLVDFDECVIVVHLESKQEDIIRTPKNVCTKRNRYYGNKPHYFLWSGDLCGIFLDPNNVDWFIFRNEHKDKCTGPCDGQCWHEILEFSCCKKYPDSGNQSEFLTKVVRDDLYLWIKEYVTAGHSGNYYRAARWYLTYIVKPGNEHKIIEPLVASKESEVQAKASNLGHDSDNSDSEISSSSQNEEEPLPETREMKIRNRERHRMVHWNFNSECKMNELEYLPGTFSDEPEWCYSALANIYAFHGSQTAASSDAISMTVIHRLDPDENIYDKTEKAWRNKTALQILTYMINEDVWVKDTIKEPLVPNAPYAIPDAIAPGKPSKHKTSLPMVLPCKQLVFNKGGDEYKRPVERWFDEDGFEERVYERRYWTQSEEEEAEEEEEEEIFPHEIDFANNSLFNASQMKRGPETWVAANYHCITTSAYKTSVYGLRGAGSMWFLLTYLPYSLYSFPFFQIGEMSVAHFETLPNSTFEDFSDQIGQSTVAIPCVNASNRNKGQSSACYNKILNGKQYQEKLGKAWQQAFDKK